ncbi:MAG: Uma2 family endonuclease [Planctomycetota bacterium]|nr:Uma2 family endonuclease [Planctomycetota bacterium]
MVVSSLTSEQRVVLHGVSWETYERLTDELEGRGGVRLTYVRGSLELMSPSYAHDKIKRLIGRLIESYTLEAGIPIASGGSTTFKRRDLDRGLEPDECYWVQREPAIRGKSELDLLVDPPPDLAVEVEISRSALNKLSVYAALGVPEVWRHDGERLEVLLLGTSGEYAPTARSAALPGLPPDEVTRALARHEEVDETTLVREFVARARAAWPGA